jgi:tripartite-type tricarboxylate transporter receptor subunit TctC
MVAGLQPDQQKKGAVGMIKGFLGLAVSAFSWLVVTSEVRAQTFPDRNITIIVPFAAGGPTDIVARVISAQMSNSLGRTVVVENVVGAAGTVGLVRAARSAADGHTLLLSGMSTMSFSPTLYPNLAAHAVNSFEPVGIVASAPIVLVAGKSVPANSVKEFAEYLRASGDKAVNGHAGVGSSSHLSCTLLNSRLGGNPAVASYRGTAPAMNDILTGQVHYLCDQTTSVMGQIQAGEVKALAVLAQQRSPALPSVPTIAEAGFPGAEMVLWNAIFAPRGTPKEIIQKLNAAIAAGLDAPDARKRFTDLGAEAPGPDQRSPDALRSILAADVEKWGKVIRDAGVQPIN